jgi:SAM-dependent methyltransferase
MNWEQHTAAWSSPPVDDVGYLPSADLLGRTDDQLRDLVETMRTARYTGWRNHGGLWREVLGLDTTTGRDVLDFGCGTGVEALEYARSGNRVGIADLCMDNLMLAYRIVRLIAPDARTPRVHLVTDQPPYLPAGRMEYDVVHCSGVLHHIPWARQIMERFHSVLRPGGEVRLMLYSDQGWRIATGTEPPVGLPQAHPEFRRFVRYFDAVGEYADWYDKEKVNRLFGDLFRTERFAYLTADRRYCAAVLRRRDPWTDREKAA